MNRALAIFDLDGTISDDRRRRPLLPRDSHRDRDYDAYHADCGEDPLVNGALVRDHVANGHHVVFITARPFRFWPQTDAWLRKHFGSLPNYSLLMRPNGNTDPSPQLKTELFATTGLGLEWESVVAAYDDRDDVLEAYAVNGVALSALRKISLDAPSVPEVLREMATTFEERNAVYGSNYKMIGPLMRVLFPHGVPPEVLHSDQFHLFELKLVKLSRFAISGLTHVDSIHDDAVYSAMIESILLESGVSR